MKKILFINLFLFLVLEVSVGQKWSYTSGGNAFDGKYKVAKVKGSGGEFPYDTPLLIVNYFEADKSLNVYFSDVGYAGCDNKIAYIKFDNNNSLYTFLVSSNSNNKAWFLSDYASRNANSLSHVGLLEKMKSHNKIFVRLKSDCGQNDYEFSLVGSSAAINYAASDYIKEKKEIEIEKAKKEELKKDNLQKIISGKAFKTKVRYFSDVYYSQEAFAYYPESINKGEEIIISNYSKYNKFCIILKATSFEIPPDTILYINKDCVDLEFLENLEDLND